VNPLSDLVSARDGPPSGLTDPEREVLFALAIVNVAAQLRVSALAATLQLDRAAARGDVVLEGDDQHATLTVAGRPVVRVGRRALRAMAT
jgi:hypothetical protein